MEILNLWEDIIFINKSEITPTPLKIIKKQAEYLTEATKGILTGKVEFFSSEKKELKHIFGIKATFLHGYEYPLLILVQNPEELYPCKIQLSISNDNNVKIINSEKELMDFLKEIFAASNVKKVISTLISQSDVTL